MTECHGNVNVDAHLLLKCKAFDKSSDYSQSSHNPNQALISTKIGSLFIIIIFNLFTFNKKHDILIFTV